MSNIQLSIVMPVFNGLEYIDGSIRSIMDQIVEGVELIVVDDGSTDGTSERIRLLFKTQMESGYLSLLRQTNQGVSAARNLGIEKARGHYVGFMDADDALLPSYVDKLLETIKGGADIVEFGFKVFKADIKEAEQFPTLYTNAQFGNFSPAQIMCNVHAIARWYPWSRVYRASIFNTVRFPVGVRFCEDLMTIPLLYDQAQRITVLQNALYGYRTNPSSATFNVRPDYLEKLLEFYKSIPRVGQVQHDFLRFAVAYAYYSCQVKAKSEWQMPEMIKQDLKKMRFYLSTYRYLEPRKVLILLFPNMYRLFQICRGK